VLHRSTDTCAHLSLAGPQTRAAKPPIRRLMLQTWTAWGVSHMCQCYLASICQVLTCGVFNGLLWHWLCCFGPLPDCSSDHLLSCIQIILHHLHVQQQIKTFNNRNGLVLHVPPNPVCCCCAAAAAAAAAADERPNSHLTFIAGR